MIKEKDIKRRFAEVLSDNGFNVVASEIEEGFEKPAVFVDVYPSSVKLFCCGGATEEVTDSVEIKYIPKDETIEDCINTAEILKKIFLYNTFDVNDRKLTIQEIEFDIEKNVLYTYFDISFIQATKEFDDDETMENLQIGVKTREE